MSLIKVRLASLRLVFVLALSAFGLVALLFMSNNKIKPAPPVGADRQMGVVAGDNNSQNEIGGDTELNNEVGETTELPDEADTGESVETYVQPTLPVVSPDSRTHLAPANPQIFEKPAEEVIEEALVSVVDAGAVRQAPAVGSKFFTGVYDCNIFWGGGRNYPFRPEIVSVYSDWSDYENIALSLANAFKYNPDYVMLSLEPFTTASGNSYQVYSDTVSGSNDVVIDALLQVVSQYDTNRVMIRWAQEMELPQSFPWSGRDPAEFKSAWQYFVNKARTVTPGIKWVWSPAGNANAAAYYPGASYVDVVGVTLLSYEDWHKAYGYGGDGSFDVLFAEKYKNVSSLGKPVFITELGIAAPSDVNDAQLIADIKSAWMERALQNLAKYPLLSGSVYFNCQNPPNFTRTVPDWRLIDLDLLWSPIELNGI